LWARRELGGIDLNKRDTTRFKKLLLEQREELQGNQKKALTGDVHVDPDDFPDEIDTASSEVTLQFTGRLREREQGLLAKIDAALAKNPQIAIAVVVEHGSHGSSAAAPVAKAMYDAYFKDEEPEKVVIRD
jgi:hypothetical protein